ncbi:translocation/assembly module TamB domain-containing protein [Labrenzia sp. PHM005]|uniref:translocation/assembly module TamB domain-containing protein n=1 Tax=Labrenzia sp. PHM005 TaxID=2590016 RepID=UPI00113FDE91|nr:translocation/assembly module TamB domain-containing protein [Labrenzia sp. PHM005]QDG77872.1 hypothetical protein FJ695_19515 [Labrenzia sp. PHM005]
MRFLKLSLRIFGLLAAVAVAVPLFVIVCLQFPSGRTLLSNVVSDLASKPGQTVEIEDLYIGFGLDASAKRIAIADDTGLWLEAEEINLSWSPSHLLSGSLDLDAVALKRLDFNRLPHSTDAAEPNNDTANTSQSSFGLPFDISLNALTVREINLGEPVLGTPIAMALTGSGTAALEPAVFAAELSVKRIDGVDGFLTASAEFAPEDETLTFDIKASEPRGGIAARLMDVPNLPALGLTLTGSGPIDDWAADLAISLDGHQTVSGNAKLTKTLAIRNLTFDLDGDLAPLAPPEIQAFLLGTTRATGSADFSLNFAPYEGEIDLKTQTVTLSGKGEIVEDRISAKADLTINAGNDALIAVDFDGRRVAFGPVHAQLSADGPLTSADWTAEAGLQSFQTTEAQVDRLTLKASGSGADFTPNILATPFNFDLDVHGFQGLAPETQALSGRLSATANGHLKAAEKSVNLVTLDVKSNVADIGLSDTVLSQDKAAGNGNVSVFDLAFLSQLAGRDLGGALAANISFDVNPTALSGTAEFSAAGNDIKTGVRQADALLHGKTDVTGSIALNGPTSISIQDLSVKNATLNATAAADYSNGALTSNLSLSLLELARADPQLGGALDLSAKTTGPVDKLEISASARSKQILLAGTPLDNLDLNVDAIADRTAPSADIKGSADLSGQNVSIDVDLTSDKGSADLDPLAIRLAGNSVTGALTVSDLDKPLETLSGALKIDAPDLASISPLVLTDLSGSVKGTLTADPDKTKLLLDLTGADIDIPSLSLGSLSLKADLTQPYDPRSLSAHLQLTDLITPATPVRSADITARPAGDGTALNADVKLEEGAEDGLSLSAHLSQPSADSYTLALNQLALTYQGIKSQLKHPAAIRYTDGTADISPLELALGKGSLSISGSAGQTLGLQAALNAVPLSLANAFVPSLDIGGTLSGSVSATGSASDPQADWTLTGAGLTAAPLKANGLSALGLSSTGTLKNNQINQQTKLTDASGLSVSADGRIGLKSPQPISLSVAGTIPMAALRRPLLEAGIRADGGVSLKGTVGGNAQAPAYTLTAAPSGLKITSLSTGLTVQNIRGSAAITQDQASLNGIAGDLATGGSLSATGTVGMKNGSPANLTLALDRARYIDPGLVNAEVDAKISVTGALASASAAPLIGGTVTINKADVSIPESLPGAIAPVEVRHLHASAAVRRQAAELGGGKKQSATEQKSNPPRLDVLVSAPGRIFVRGRGLDAELEGNLKVVGTTADPQAVGAFSLRRGQFDILTRRLTFSYGRATFEGSMTPVLDFAATSTVSDTTITVKVSGDADNPEISFSSSPELPQDEVLALLLFGKRVGNLSASQIAQLGAAIATLTGGSDSGPLAQIRKSLGLDAIDIDTSGEDGPSVSVGRYINDNIYLGVEQGTRSDSSRVKVDIDLDRGLKVRGEVGADGSSKAGIFFEREY